MVRATSASSEQDRMSARVRRQGVCARQPAQLGRRVPRGARVRAGACAEKACAASRRRGGSSRSRACGSSARSPHARSPAATRARRHALRQAAAGRARSMRTAPDGRGIARAGEHEQAVGAGDGRSGHRPCSPRGSWRGQRRHSSRLRGGDHRVDQPRAEAGREGIAPRRQPGMTSARRCTSAATIARGGRRGRQRPAARPGGPFTGERGVPELRLRGPEARKQHIDAVGRELGAERAGERQRAPPSRRSIRHGGAGDGRPRIEPTSTIAGSRPRPSTGRLSRTSSAGGEEVELHDRGRSVAGSASRNRPIAPPPGGGHDDVEAAEPLAGGRRRSRRRNAGVGDVAGHGRIDRTGTVRASSSSRSRAAGGGEHRGPRAGQARAPSRRPTPDEAPVTSTRMPAIAAAPRGRGRRPSWPGAGSAGPRRHREAGSPPGSVAGSGGRAAARRLRRVDPAEQRRRDAAVDRHPVVGEPPREHLAVRRRARRAAGRCRIGLDVDVAKARGRGSR